jgi:hypothetical protein
MAAQWLKDGMNKDIIIMGTFPVTAQVIRFMSVQLPMSV